LSLVTVGKSGHVAVVSLNRPEALNAISGTLADELTTACEEVAGDREVWAVVIRAEGEKAFCVGADLKERSSFDLDDFHVNRAKMVAMFAAVRNLPQPSVAAIFGFALGGGFEIALSCDLIVAAQGTQMGLPELRVGLLPAGGGTQLLVRRIGLARAKDVIFRSKRVDAIEARDMGIVSEVTERDALDATSLALAEEICKGSPVAAQAAKRALDAAVGTPLPEGMELENQGWKEVIASTDRAEGIAAFNEKRDPDWTNS
jgi:enoyl-CoA hydratase/carnithine racemase